MQPNVKIFTIGLAKYWTESISRQFREMPCDLREEHFADGEGKITPVESVDGSHALVFQSLIGEANNLPDQKIAKLVFFLHTLRDLGVREITVVAPYLAYSRSDMQHDEFDAIYLKTIANMLENAGLSRLVTLDVHNLSAFQNAYRTAMPINLETAPIFCDRLSRFHFGNDPIAVLSPDYGGIKRADKFRTLLEKTLARRVDFAFLEKHRTRVGLSGGIMAGQVKGARVIIVDDMISTGGTVLRAIKACEAAEAVGVVVVATHGIFSGSFDAIFASPLLQKLFVTNSNPLLQHSPWSMEPKLEVLPWEPLLVKLVAQFGEFSASGIGEQEDTEKVLAGGTKVQKLLRG